MNVLRTLCSIIVFCAKLVAVAMMGIIYHFGIMFAMMLGMLDESGGALCHFGLYIMLALAGFVALSEGNQTAAERELRERVREERRQDRIRRPLRPL